ncbi:hypothetical protein FRC0316_02062 [Corynebacterium diphtheriae]|uniref:hypothetical protein n=1 Tax=Corynebacterium diphtheriae TaxID=1717 RepID=UPI0011607EE9|nr:hypothetical protein [Corynebacterium diphtheriae]CAB0571811.1 hypothetical protein CIP107524_02176 [Corynebacterium diphtheriae]CAB0619320.1 hypothetical protein CIP107559_02215 [Corynebacterium diphtheriae]CAB0664073.1 hypothetical protein FRC0016_01984 [Corynebacterium diphtheriae]CAB0667130.1 hypothetical protein CIP107567_02160 [Corynebacterium diphtheriae]CAB0780889.1 hypothetical protein FRC0182_01994 [Corynebacterium diphtheriae]
MNSAIDTHAHIYPAPYLDMLEKAGVDPASTKIARNLGADSTSDDIEKRLLWMDRAGGGCNCGVAASERGYAVPSPAH